MKLVGLRGSLTDQGRTVVERIAAGEIAPEQASTIMGAISAQARIIEVDELEKRIARLEAQSDRFSLAALGRQM
ncbi:MAG: hypothetical protein WCE38_12410 [Burkholderiales bacterium]